MTEARVCSQNASNSAILLMIITLLARALVVSVSRNLQRAFGQELNLHLHLHLHLQVCLAHLPRATGVISPGSPHRTCEGEEVAVVTGGSV